MMLHEFLINILKGVVERLIFEFLVEPAKLLGQFIPEGMYICLVGAGLLIYP